MNRHCWSASLAASPLAISCSHPSARLNEGLITEHHTRDLAVRARQPFHLEVASGVHTVVAVQPAAIWTNEQSQQRRVLGMNPVQHVGNGIGACVVPIPYIEWFEEQPDR